MTARSTLPHFRKLSPATIDGLRAMGDAAKSEGLEARLLELIKLRASQINGCAFCIAMHVGEARKLGVEDTTMHLLAAWHHAPGFSQRERAALAWTEALTQIASAPVSDQVYAEAAHTFSDKELADLTGAIVAINGFNRIAGAYRFVQPPAA